MSEDRREMRRMRRERTTKTSTWVAIGAVVLIILLIVWLTMADFFGDTDVAAFASPAMMLNQLGSYIQV